MRGRQLSHGPDTDQTRIVFRVPSVFHPWLQPPFVSIACFVAPISCAAKRRGPGKKSRVKAMLKMTQKNSLNRYAARSSARIRKEFPILA